MSARELTAGRTYGFLQDEGLLGQAAPGLQRSQPHRRCPEFFEEVHSGAAFAGKDAPPETPIRVRITNDISGKE